MLYFAHGAQFAASRAALRSTPKKTYEYILGLVEAGHFEVKFYLEMICGCTVRLRLHSVAQLAIIICL